MVDPESLQGRELLRVPPLVSVSCRGRRTVLVVQAGEQHTVNVAPVTVMFSTRTPSAIGDDAVGPNAPAVDHGVVAVNPANRDVRGVDQQLLRIVAGPDQDGAARCDAIGGLAEGRDILRYPDRVRPFPPRRRFPGRFRPGPPSDPQPISTTAVSRRQRNRRSSDEAWW